MMKSDFSPYFESMSKRKRVCPKCAKRFTSLSRTLNPNAAMEKCDCGYIQTIVAPKNAHVSWDGKKPWRNPNKSYTPRIIKLDEVPRAK